MQLVIHNVFKIGMLANLICLLLITFLPTVDAGKQTCYSTEQLASAERGTKESDEIPLKANNQNASEVEEDDDDSAREFFAYLYSDKIESDFFIQTLSVDYAPVQGEISTPPPRV